MCSNIIIKSNSTKTRTRAVELALIVLTNRVGPYSYKPTRGLAKIYPSEASQWLTFEFNDLFHSFTVLAVSTKYVIAIQQNIILAAMRMEPNTFIFGCIDNFPMDFTDINILYIGL